MSFRTPLATGAALVSLVLASCGGSSATDPDLYDSATDKDTEGSSDTGGGTDSTTTDSGSPPDTDVTDTGSPTDTPVGDTPVGDTPVGDTGSPTDGSTTASIKYVWVILMENHNWSSIKGSASAPYINKTLLPGYARAEQYFNPPKLHPSEPNYIWMEAGDNLGITNDSDPSANHKATKDHLVTYLQTAGITWKSYQEDVPDGTKCPLSSSGLYAAKHNPMVFFDDVTDTNSPTSANCIAHVRPYGELATDMAAGKTARYNFLTPNLCNDMHGETLGTACGILPDLIKKGDTWLSTEVPKIMATAEYKAGGAIFITWDEGEGLISPSDGPIGMIVVSPFAKVGYSNTIKYTHSSFLRTMQTIFNVKPFLRDADKATDLGDLFKTFP